MGLYFTRTLLPQELGTSVSIDAGILCVYPFTLEANQTFKLDVIHNGHVQDWSLRVWVSAEPNGLPVLYRPQHTYTWTARREPSFPVFIHDRSLLAPAADNVLGLLPGDYFVNVLNLINSENSFVLTLGAV